MTATPVFNSEEDYETVTGLLKLDNATFETTTTLQGEANRYDYLLEIKNRSVALTGSDKVIMELVMRGGHGLLTGCLKRIATSSIYSLKEFLNGVKDSDFVEEYELESFYGIDKQGGASNEQYENEIKKVLQD